MLKDKKQDFERQNTKFARQCQHYLHHSNYLHYSNNYFFDLFFKKMSEF